MGILLVLTMSFSSLGLATAAGTAKADTKATKPAASVNNTSTVQGYGSDKALQVGTIVELSGTAKVTPASLTKLDQIYGVTVDPHSLSITVSDESVANEAYVATTGTYDVLVSSQGGPIKVGDYITVSSLDGVGMKASPDQSIVLGRATSEFDAKNNVAGTTELKDTTGKVVKSVTLGIITVAVDIRHNPNEKSTKAEVPQWLQRVGEAVAEKPVGPLRIYLSIAITGISIVATIVMLSSGVKSSLVAIGRNPLSKKSIYRGLLEVIMTSLIVLIIGLFAVYLLLKL
jgi:hypothetical protein